MLSINNAGRRILSRFSNKRITRLESEVELDDTEFNRRLINRNPLNLEQLSFEKKPSGFWLEKSPPLFWNKLVFEPNGRYLNAYLQHWSGRKLVEASTSEPQLSKYFKSPNTSQATNVLAQVISRRCLQSGYLNAGFDEDLKKDDLGPKIRAFYETVESSGITLHESPEIVPRNVSDL